MQKFEYVAEHRKTPLDNQFLAFMFFKRSKFKKEQFKKCRRKDGGKGSKIVNGGDDQRVLSIWKTRVEESLSSVLSYRQLFFLMTGQRNRKKEMR